MRGDAPELTGSAAGKGSASAPLTALKATSDQPWPSEDPSVTGPVMAYCLGELERLLEEFHGEVAGIVIEPVMQGAAGMVCQPAGFLRGVADLAKRYDTLLIADEVATGFGRTGRMFACEYERVEPDILCLAKGLTGGYLPLAATLATDRIERAFLGHLTDHRTLYHGHTYTGNALGCAAAIASLKLFDENRLLEHIQQSAAIITERLHALRGCPHVVDVRQRGIMVGIELATDSHADDSGHGPNPSLPSTHTKDPEPDGSQGNFFRDRAGGGLIRISVWRR